MMIFLREQQEQGDRKDTNASVQMLISLVISDRRQQNQGPEPLYSV